MEQSRALTYVLSRVIPGSRVGVRSFTRLIQETEKLTFPPMKVLEVPSLSLSLSIYIYIYISQQYDEDYQSYQVKK